MKRATKSKRSSFFLSSLRKLPEAGAISVMPDYFVDRFVRIDSVESLALALKLKSSSGGGSIRGIPQHEAKGGNAVNLAYALGKLGTRVNLIAIADSLTVKSLRSTFEEMPNVHLHVVNGKPGLTVALEFLSEDGKRGYNVMLSDAGDLSSFDGSTISSSSLQRIKKSKIACVVNWASNEKGTELCEKIFSLSKKSGVRTFLAPADISSMPDMVRQMKERLLDPKLVDILSLNENEARLLAKEITGNSLLPPRNFTILELKDTATKLSRSFGSIIVDIHTSVASVSASNDGCVAASCRRLKQNIVTGAGDVWDAGDLIGYLLKWAPEKRLEFANSCAGVYVSGKNAEAPSTQEVLSFIFSGPS